ncbi:MAG: AMP-binding protein [Phycisphaerae bacterium]|nr:AMP-binding protein [Phycisphaerae bacterium]
MLVDALLQSAARSPGKLAVSDPRIRLSYRRLVAASLALRRILEAETRRERVGIMLPAGSGFAAALFGTLWAGKAAVPLNFLLNPAELRSVVEDAGIDRIVSVHHFDELLGLLPARPLPLEDMGLRSRIIRGLLRRKPAPPCVGPKETAAVLYTSGTDGAPKGVVLSYGNLLSNCEDCIATARITPDHRFLNVLPPFHVFGLTTNVLIPAVLGASVHCIPRFQPAAVVQAMRQEHPSILMAIPSMYAALLRAKDTPPDTYRRLYLAISGGEPLHSHVADGFRSRFGIELLQGYGLTETSPVVSLNLPDAHRPGSIGRPIRNVQVRIVDEDGVHVPHGTDGDIQVRGPGVMQGYHGRPDLTHAALSADGWFRTGDVGRQDADGFLYITGRKKEMMIVGGENVFPREIEAALLDHPAVAEAAVVGVPDASRGEVPAAFVICREGRSATDAELRAFVRERLAGYKVPRFVRVAEELPRSPTGKVHKRLLKKML